MKSKIRDAVIVPKGLLGDRKLKYLIKGYGWIDDLLCYDKRLTALLTLKVEAVLNPENLFFGEVGYSTSTYCGTADFNFSKFNKISKLVPLIIYKKNCKTGSEILI